MPPPIRFPVSLGGGLGDLGGSGHHFAKVMSCRGWLALSLFMFVGSRPNIDLCQGLRCAFAAVGP